MSGNYCDKIQVRQMRKIGPTRRSVSGSYSFRGKDAIQYESTLERDFLIRHEFFPEVISITPQPVEIPFIADSGISYTYTPDFLVCLQQPGNHSTHYVLVEVKPRDLWVKNWRAWSSKWKAARRFARLQGWSFRIYDESRIRDVALENIKFLERYQRFAQAPEHADTLLKALRQLGPLSRNALFTHCGVLAGEERAWLVATWYLLATRTIDCDIKQHLDGSTLFWTQQNG